MLVLRHEGLRTTLPASAPGTQSVAGAGELTVAVYESGGDSDGCALDVAGRMRAIRFDTAAELPIRVAVIVTGGIPAWVVFVLSHVAVDTIGQRLFRREWTALASGEQLPPPAAMQPVDLGEWEQTPEGQRRITSPLRYWEDLLRTTPQAMFAAPGIGPTDWMLPGSKSAPAPPRRRWPGSPPVPGRARHRRAGRHVRPARLPAERPHVRRGDCRRQPVLPRAE